MGRWVDGGRVRYLMKATLQKRRIRLRGLANERGVQGMVGHSEEIRYTKVIKFDTWCECNSQQHWMRLYLFLQILGSLPQTA